VVAFVVITSLMNLGLGYALALFLGRSARAYSRPSESATHLPSFGYPNPDVTAILAADPMFSKGEAAPLPWSSRTAGTETPRGAYAGMGEGAANSADGGSLRDKPTTTESPEATQTRTAAAEQDLLAGIEEFRNQLAQLKGQTAPVGA
jgi:hypothetical protein